MQIKLNQYGELALTVEGSSASVRSSTVVIPLSVGGLKVLHQILAADQKERAAGKTPRFATPAAPTQEMVREYLRTHEVKKSVVAKPSAASPVFDLDLSSIELNF